MKTLRTISASPVESLEAVRAISEGKAPAKVLRAVPFVEFTAPAAKPEENVFNLVAKVNADFRTITIVGTPIAEAMEKFRQEIGDAEFTSMQCAKALQLYGWVNKNPQLCAAQRLNKMDVVEVVRREGMQNIYRFNGGEK